MWQHKEEGLLEKFQEGLRGEEGWEEQLCLFVYII